MLILVPGVRNYKLGMPPVTINSSHDLCLSSAMYLGMKQRSLIILNVKQITKFLTPSSALKAPNLFSILLISLSHDLAMPSKRL